MTYTVAIRNNATGEIRMQPEDLDWHEASLFWWTEGNFACDCNRGNEWHRAGGVAEDDLPESMCGDAKFSVLYAEFPNGSKITIDEPSNKSGGSE